MFTDPGTFLGLLSVLGHHEKLLSPIRLCLRGPYPSQLSCPLEMNSGLHGLFYFVPVLGIELGLHTG